MEITSESAVVHLRGHGSTPAVLAVSRYSVVGWSIRVVRYVAGWLGVSGATLIFTFDPFVASFPFVIGLGYVYRTVRGRYHVRHFEGNCPRCSARLALKPGSKIPLPYDLVCYSCHHEPQLRIATPT
jgi:hypothetical protein